MENVRRDQLLNSPRAIFHTEEGLAAAAVIDDLARYEQDPFYQIDKLREALTGAQERLVRFQKKATRRNQPSEYLQHLIGSEQITVELLRLFLGQS